MPKGRRRKPLPGSTSSVESRVAQPSPIREPLNGSGSPAAGYWYYAGLGLLLLLTLLAYHRTFTAGFLRWDDQFYVTENPLLSTADGLRKIWDVRARATQQYYPLTFSSFWLEYRLWGFDARGYHAVNVVLHLINTALVAGVLRALGLSPVATLFGAGVFALHPAQVASVAWIAERKNVLAGVFCFLCLRAFCRHLARSTLASYTASWFAFVAALLAKTQVVGLPLSLFTLTWLGVGKQEARRPGTLANVVEVGLLLLPFVVVALLLAVVTVGYEQAAWTPAFSFVERLLVSTNALVFYLRTVLWPVGLSPIYPQWQIDPAQPGWWFAPVLVAALFAGAAWWREQIPGLVWWGTAHFLVMLLPVVGIVSFNFFTYSFVADHFLYFSLLGAAAALGALVDVARKLSGAGTRWLALAGLLLGLAGLSYRETFHWQDNLTFWLRVQQRDPNGFLGAYNLGNHYRQTGEWELAARWYERAAAIRPRADYAFRRYAEAVRRARGPEAALAVSDGKLRSLPNFPAALVEKGIALEELGKVEEAREAYKRALALSQAGSALQREAAARLGSLATAAPRRDGS